MATSPSHRDGAGEETSLPNSILANGDAHGGDEKLREKENDGDDDLEAAATFVPPPMGMWQRRLVMLSLCLTLFLGALDITIISTALPSIASQLHATTQQYAWVGSAYTLSYTASMLVWTKVSDITGRKPVIMAAAATFMAGSLICALSSSPSMLVGGRVVQGLGGGGSLVMVTIVIGDIFSLADRAKYYGMTGAVWGVASAIGPVLGGVFTQDVSWRWCFYINLPIDGIALVVLYFFLKVEIKTIPLVEGIRTLDWVGFLLVIGGTISFLYGLEVGSSGMSPWGSAKVICLIVFGFLLLAGFMVWEANFTKYPVVPFRIFKQRTNIAAYLVACLHGFVFISFDFFLPLYFQVVLGLKPLISGVTLFALILPLAASTMGGGAVTRKTGNYKILIVGGSLLMCLGCGLFILFEPRRNWPKIILLQVVAGLGAGTMFQSPMIALQSYLRQKDTAAAMAAFSFLRTLFTSMSQVIGTVLMQRTLGSSSTSLVPGGSNGAIDKNKYVEALHIMWAFYTAVAGLIIICSFFIKQRPKTEQPATTPPNGGLEEAKRDAQSPEELVGSENDVKP